MDYISLGQWCDANQGWMYIWKIEDNTYPDLNQMMPSDTPLCDVILLAQLKQGMLHQVKYLLVDGENAG